jgi:xylulokinase
MNIIVLDLGTTNFKASVFDARGALLVHAQLPTPTRTTENDVREIDVETFRDTVRELLRRLNQASKDITKRAAAITFATQTNSFVLLDQDDDPLSPIILWTDNRAQAHQEEVEGLAALPNFQATTGVPALSHQFMAGKLLWFRAQQPDAFGKTARICLLSDYLTLWLTKQHVSEAGAAGLTGLLNIHTLEWWPVACEKLGLKTEQLPRVTRAGTNLGPINSTVADDLELPNACCFVVGCLDQYAGAIGVGNVVPGGVSETTGTVLATVRHADTFRINPPAGVFQGPAFAPGAYYQMVFGDTAANWLEDYRNDLDDKPSFEQLTAEAAEVAPGADGLSLPADCAPIERKARLIQHATTHSRGHAVRVILETVARALQEQVQMLAGADMPIQIACAGGAARSPLWLQIKANLLQIPMLTMDCPEPTSLGAALLALAALSDDSLRNLAQEIATPAHTAMPDNDSTQE